MAQRLEWHLVTLRRGLVPNRHRGSTACPAPSAAPSASPRQAALACGEHRSEYPFVPLSFPDQGTKNGRHLRGPDVCQETAEQILLLRKMLLFPVCPGDRPHCLPLGCNEIRGPSAQATLTGVPGTNPRIQTDDGSSSHWEPPQPTLGAPSGCSTGPTHGLMSVTLLLAMTPNGWGAL